jgi:hypothetical protein
MMAKILTEPSLSTVDIVVKCGKYPEFRKELEEIARAYDSALQLSLNYSSPVPEADYSRYLQFVRCRRLYLVFYGKQLEDLPEPLLHAIYLFWIKHMDEELR